MEKTAQQLINNGASAFEKVLEEAKDGVLFVDEAYALDPKTDKIGKSIADQILTTAENCKDNMSIIIAGYQDDIEKSLYAYNIGMMGRFEQVNFEDFSKIEICRIWDRLLVKQKGWIVEGPNVSKVACNRIASKIGTKGFSNARLVNDSFIRATNEAISRRDFDPQKPMIKIIDIIGENPATNVRLKSIRKKLEDMTGLAAVKAEVDKLIKIADKNYQSECKGEQAEDFRMNRVFLGNPGTGKYFCFYFCYQSYHLSFFLFLHSTEPIACLHTILTNS